MRKVLKEFKDFAIKGNMFDMAIGIIIGTAFGKVVSSLVKDIIMPPFGLLLGKVDFNNFHIVLQEAITKENGEIIPGISLSYGIFIGELINFLIIAWSIFFVIRLFNKLRIRAEDTSDKKVVTPKDIELLTEIRDILKSNSKS
jgi:large conductance mechanosensitive channel